MSIKRVDFSFDEAKRGIYVPLSNNSSKFLKVTNLSFSLDEAQDHIQEYELTGYESTKTNPKTNFGRRSASMQQEHFYLNDIGQIIGLKDSYDSWERMSNTAAYRNVDQDCFLNFMDMFFNKINVNEVLSRNCTDERWSTKYYLLRSDEVSPFEEYFTWDKIPEK